MKIMRMKNYKIIIPNFEIIVTTLLAMISAFSFYMFYMLGKTIDIIEKKYNVLTTQHDELNIKHNVLLQKYEELVTSYTKSELEINTMENIPIDSSSSLLIKSIEILIIIFLILLILYAVSQIQFQIPVLSQFVGLF